MISPICGMSKSNVCMEKGMPRSLNPEFMEEKEMERNQGVKREKEGMGNRDQGTQ